MCHHSLYLFDCILLIICDLFSLLCTHRCPPPLPHVSHTHPNRHETPRGAIPLWATPSPLRAWVSITSLLNLKSSITNGGPMDQTCFNKKSVIFMKRFNFKWVRFDPNTMGVLRLKKTSSSVWESAAASSYLLEPGGGGKQPLFLSFSNGAKFKYIKARQDTQSKRRQRWRETSHISTIQ